MSNISRCKLPRSKPLNLARYARSLISEGWMYKKSPSLKESIFFCNSLVSAVKILTPYIRMNILIKIFRFVLKIHLNNFFKISLTFCPETFPLNLLIIIPMYAPKLRSFFSSTIFLISFSISLSDKIAYLSMSSKVSFT